MRPTSEAGGGKHPCQGLRTVLSSWMCCRQLVCNRKVGRRINATSRVLCMNARACAWVVKLQSSHSVVTRTWEQFSFSHQYVGISNNLRAHTVFVSVMGNDAPHPALRKRVNMAPEGVYLAIPGPALASNYACCCHVRKCSV
jgi:hypothetical protein